METLNDGIWDIIIAGTSLPQSLLALSLSRSGQKVLHVDRNNYYGGSDAAFSLQEAEHWVKHLEQDGSGIFSNAFIEQPEDGLLGRSSTPLAPTRSYNLSLNPQVIYAQSQFLPTLVSSQVHTQLEFLAVGSWWVLRDSILRKIPSSREDVFSDDNISTRDKRSLMKLLRFVLQPEEDEQTVAVPTEPQSLKEALQRKFNVPDSLQTPILALALSPDPASTTDFDIAVQNIRRHMRSVGYFGPGFGAVIAKYGGNAEIAQVACRAQAVGGGVYLLGHGINGIISTKDETGGSLLHVTLSDGTVVRARRVVGTLDDLSTSEKGQAATTTVGLETLHLTTIVSGSLKSLFSATSENGPVPAAAIVLVEDQDAIDAPPIYLQIHSEDTGECPAGQCVIYASTRTFEGDSSQRLRNSLDVFLNSLPPESAAQTLWTLSYSSRRPANAAVDLNAEKPILTIPDQSFSLALEDSLLDNVRAVWSVVTGQDSRDQIFLRFDEREQASELQD